MTLVSSKIVEEIPLNLIDPNPYQPRRYFDNDMIKQLAVSIQTYGVMQPVSIRKKENRYELIAGERRLRAVKMTDLKTIPAIIFEASDKDSTVLALVENLQRENLNYMEEAEGYYNLIHDYHFTQEEIAQKVGKSQSTIANKLRLLNLTPDVVYILFKEGLSERHGRALLSLKNEDLQFEALKTIVNKELNVKQTEELIQQMLKNQEKSKKPEFNVKHYLKDIRIFTNTIKQAVDMMKSSGVDVDYKIEQDEDAYQITIHIPMEKDKETK